MRIKVRRKLMIAVAFPIAIGLGTQVWAQSGTRTPARSPRPAMQGSGTTRNEAPVAMSGYCPVCVLEMKKWIKGDRRFAVVQDGKTYFFPSEEQKQMFLQNPNKYTPALGGKCTVCLAEMGKMIDGTVQFAALHEGRLFLFPSEEQKQMFLKNPAKYGNVDLAANGQCTVCRVELQQEVQGKPEYAAIYKNMRYWFPSQEQLRMFVANPAKYEVR